MRPAPLDPVLAAHLLACPACREVDDRLTGVPAPRETAVPPRVWANVLRDVHRHPRRSHGRPRRRALRRPPR